MREPVAIVGWATTDFLPDQGLALDELAFSASSAALRDAALGKSDIGLTLVVSSDLFEARTISHGMTSPASGGYLNDEYRFQNDAGTAVINAATAILGREIDVAIVTAFHSPEQMHHDPEAWLAFHDQISNYTFDPHFTRPVGTTGRALLGMHAAAAVDSGETSVEEMASLAATEIEVGGDGPHAYRRGPSDAAAVQSAPLVAAPLTELMMPALCTGAVSIVLASRARARRFRHVHGWLTGWGMAETPYIWNPQWLEDPAQSTRTAARQAYAQAGIGDPRAELEVAETTVLTPALKRPVSEALQLHNGVAEPGGLNPSGGVRSTYPGLANGSLRLVEVLTRLDDRPGNGAGAKGLVHSTDWISGTAASTAAVMVVEGA